MSETDPLSPDNTTPDLELLARARGGDDSAFAELWSVHEGFARNSALSITTSIDPDGLASESFARIFERIRAGGGPTGSFRSYLYVSIRNLAAEWGRARREFTTEDETLFESIEATGADPATDGERELMIRAFASLPDRWREALWYTEVEGLPRAEAAQKLHLKPNALAQLTYRAREGLRAAWIQEHIPTFAVGSDCRWAVERMGSYEREHLGKRDRTRFEAHVGRCASCSRLVELAEETGSRIRIILLPILLGGGYAAWEAARTPQRALADGGGHSGRSIGPRRRGRAARAVLGGLAAAAIVVSAPGAASVSVGEAGPAGGATPLAQAPRLDEWPDRPSTGPEPTIPFPGARQRSTPDVRPETSNADPERATTSAPSPAVPPTTDDASEATAPPLPAPSDAQPYSVAFGGGFAGTSERGVYTIDVIVTNTSGAPARNAAAIFVPTSTYGEGYTVAAVRGPSGDADAAASIVDDPTGTTISFEESLDAGESRVFTLVIFSDPTSWPVGEGDGMTCWVGAPGLEVRIEVLGADGAADPASAITTSVRGISDCEL